MYCYNKKGETAQAVRFTGNNVNDLLSILPPDYSLKYKKPCSLVLKSGQVISYGDYIINLDGMVFGLTEERFNMLWKI